MRKTIRISILLAIGIGLALPSCKGKNNTAESKLLDSLTATFEDIDTEPTFDKKESLMGVDFSIKTFGVGENQELIISTAQSGEHYSKSLFAPISKTETADLNSDGSPELIIQIDVPGQGAYKFVNIFSSAGKLSEVAFPNIGDQPEIAQGYMGQDEYRIVDAGIERRFPIHKTEGHEVIATDQYRTILYKMKPVEGKQNQFYMAIESHSDGK